MPDRFANRTDPVDGPARSAFAITPGSSDLAVIPKALWIGGAGDLVVIPIDDTASVTLKNVPDGTVLPIRVRQVLAASTATFIVGLA